MTQGPGEKSLNGQSKLRSPPWRDFESRNHTTHVRIWWKYTYFWIGEVEAWARRIRMHRFLKPYESLRRDELSGSMQPLGIQRFSDRCLRMWVGKLMWGWPHACSCIWLARDRIWCMVPCPKAFQQLMHCARILLRQRALWVPMSYPRFASISHVRRKSVNFSLLRIVGITAITAIREGLRIGAQETARAGTATILCVIEYWVGSGSLTCIDV